MSDREKLREALVALADEMWNARHGATLDPKREENETMLRRFAHALAEPTEHNPCPTCNGPVDHAGRAQNPDDPNDPYIGGLPVSYNRVFRVEPMVAQATWQFPSMTLRDWFAGQALAGLIHAATEDEYGYNHFMVAEDAYGLADAMLKERDR